MLPNHNLFNVRFADVIHAIFTWPVVQPVALPLESLPNLDAVLPAFPVVGLPVVGLDQPPVVGGGQRFPGGGPVEVSF